jgi:hypothetical protein
LNKISKSNLDISVISDPSKQQKSTFSSEHICSSDQPEILTEGSSGNKSDTEFLFLGTKRRLSTFSRPSLIPMHSVMKKKSIAREVRDVTVNPLAKPQPKLTTRLQSKKDKEHAASIVSKETTVVSDSQVDQEADTTMESDLTTEECDQSLSGSSAPPSIGTAAFKALDFLMDGDLKQFLHNTQVEILTLSGKFKLMEQVQADNASLLAKVAQLTEELATKDDTIAQLKADNQALRSVRNGTGASMHAPVGIADTSLDKTLPVVGAAPILSDTTQQETTKTLSYAAAASQQPDPKSRRRRVTQGQRKAAARVFLEAPGESGFQTVYLPCRRRMPISELRGNLRKLKIANHRVLDVSYPANKVVALLVHNEYAKELLERFGTAGVKPINGFDPMDASHLKDPKWADKTEQERKHEATRLHCVRSLVALDHIRIPARYAVARHFVDLGWVDREVLQHMRTGEPLAPPREGGDTEMGDYSAADAFRYDGGSSSSRRVSSASAAPSTSSPTDGNSGRPDE